MTMPSLDVIFAYVVGVLAAVAVIGALVYAVVWEVCAIRRTLAAHRRQPPDASFWHHRGTVTPTSPTEGELIREGTRRIQDGQPLRRIALDWKGRSPHGQRRP
jgi:hypothetical protein